MCVSHCVVCETSLGPVVVSLWEPERVHQQYCHQNNLFQFLTHLRVFKIYKYWNLILKINDKKKKYKL